MQLDMHQQPSRLKAQAKETIKIGVACLFVQENSDPSEGPVSTLRENNQLSLFFHTSHSSPYYTSFMYNYNPFYMKLGGRGND